jgi:hypothetical protein
MATKQPPKEKQSAKSQRPGRVTPTSKVARAVRHAPVRTTALKKPLPAKSVAKAAKALKHFSLSKFSKTAAPPANFVPAKNVKNPAVVQQVQQKHIRQSLVAIKNTVPVNPGMGLSLPPAMIGTLLPSLAAGEVKLGEVLALLKSRMVGTEFYADGNPTLSRLAIQSQLQTQVQSIIDAIKGGTLT